MAKLLSFILDDGEIVDILVNEEGAEYLINVLQNRIDYGKTEHDHLFTPEWGGDELTSNNLNLDERSKLINLVNVRYFDDLNE
ncbi:hypothetical protein CE91St24_35480 [Odoribacteraceae bacterium]|uniref:Imm32 family immunity protein n=1 Tax=Butyricimonas sp. HCN-50115 TaxID=3134666 RepID=UPI00207E9DD8|nr:hypothetical protein CE91St21_19290 [Odoribacteraceae bacterium]GKH93356.1 hypothetical protein CE91St23_18520 [Odoribacteraceae bacterium]GKH99752.1 hypothetical protein CE91St22_36300 [Odoribacteraceae bacterium]GKI04273.1 hypothetical protein CE91St24_35480 [Odoribacteraceae bacterium]